jgi:hypothetical protein
MKPFNLTKALAGSPVATRDGRKVVEITSLNTPVKYPVIAVIEGEKYATTLTTYGNYKCDGSESDCDLFMSSEKKEAWINIYSGQRYGTYVWHKTKEDAEKVNGHNRVATVRVEWEE